MKDVVIIPAFNRPEFLFHCLHQIKQAASAGEFKYLFAFDFGHNPKLYHVLQGFPFEYEVIQRKPSNYTLTKMSYNTLEAYRTACSKTDGLIFLIEDDVMISNDFFLFHKKVHAAQEEIFSCHSTANHNRKIEFFEPHIEDYYLSTFDYCSLGVSFKQHILKEHVMLHANHRYYSNPMQYVTGHFPNSGIGKGFCEQAGLIRRIQEQLFFDAPTAYPYIPRAYHAGFYGKNRGRYRIYANLAEQIAHIGSIIFDDDAMKHATDSEAHYKDSRPVNLTNTLDYEVKLQHSYKY